MSAPHHQGLLLHIPPTDPLPTLDGLAEYSRWDLGRPRYMVIGPECRKSKDICSPSVLIHHLSLSLCHRTDVSPPVVTHSSLRN